MYVNNPVDEKAHRDKPIPKMKMHSEYSSKKACRKVKLLLFKEVLIIE